MQIHALAIRRFRSIRNSSLRECGGLNVLIGKNNSGKSNLLSALDLVQQHLSLGTIAAPMQSARPTDEFTDRDTTKPFQIGIEYALPPDVNTQLRQTLQADAPHVERAIDQLRHHSRLAIIVAGVYQPDGSFLFVQSVGAGRLVDSEDSLRIDGISLLEIPLPVASQLYEFHHEASGLKEDMEAIDRLLKEPYRIDSLLSDGRVYYGGEMRPSLTREIARLTRKKQTKEEFVSALQALQADASSKIESIHHRDTEEAMAAFAGATKAPPKYALALLKRFGDIKVLHLRETREAVGREEAQALLTLKVTRGGPERLSTVQNTVKALLGVTVDAFQAEESRRGRSAEIDIDQFLVEANGAGVREALRLVLDFELKKPSLVFIEEPEVHLHPGLEHAVYQYLRDKSQSIQVFVTTHSTNFVDSVSFQNIYLVSKGYDQKTSARSLDSGEGALQIPAELGLRLSTVFMFDRLVFVEGPSDEAVLRELCKTLGLDLASRNVGFVQMGGVRNFAHFAARSTLDLLSRRQVGMWFVADRDERDDADVDRMLKNLGDKAKLHVWERRELENYLMCPSAVLALIQQKTASAKTESAAQGTSDEVATALASEAAGLKSEVVRLRMHKKLLGPIHLTGQSIEGTIEARLQTAIERLQERVDAIESTRTQVESDVDKGWANIALARAPGTTLLENVMRKFNLTFSKEGGDSARLARLIRKDSIPTEIAQLLIEIATS